MSFQTYLNYQFSGIVKTMQCCKLQTQFLRQFCFQWQCTHIAMVTLKTTYFIQETASLKSDTEKELKTYKSRTTPKGGGSIVFLLMMVLKNQKERLVYCLNSLRRCGIIYFANDYGY